MSKHKAKVEIDMPQAVRMMLKANIMAYIVTAIFVLFSSLIFTYGNVTTEVENWILTAGVIVSSFLAGFDTAKVDHRNGYKWGAIGGSLYFVIFLVLGTIIEKINHLAPSVIMMMAVIIIISSTIAGIISVNCRR